MTNMINARIGSLLSRIDVLTQRVKLLHDDQQQEVRDTTVAAYRRNAYKACQFCDSATRLLTGACSMLFTDPTVNFNGPNGETSTEQNVELLAMRFHDSAGNLGLTQEDAADAVLQAVDAQVFAANVMLNEALVCEMMPC